MLFLSWQQSSFHSSTLKKCNSKAHTNVTFNFKKYLYKYTLWSQCYLCRLFQHWVLQLLPLAINGSTLLFELPMSQRRKAQLPFFSLVMHLPLSEHARGNAEGSVYPLLALRWSCYTWSKKSLHSPKKRRLKLCHGGFNWFFLCNLWSDTETRESPTFKNSTAF